MCTVLLVTYRLEFNYPNKTIAAASVSVSAVVIILTMILKTAMVFDACE